MLQLKGWDKSTKFNKEEVKRTLAVIKQWGLQTWFNCAQDLATEDIGLTSFNYAAPPLVF